MGYVVGDCSLGQNIRLEIPSNFEHGDLINDDGYLFNSTSSSITVYCEQYPNYSFRLPAWSGLEYRSNNNTYTSIPFSIDSGPYLTPGIPQLLLVAVLIISALIIICKGGAKRA